MNRKVQLDKRSILIIDGHWFARSRFAVLSKDHSITFTDNIENDKKLFLSKLTMDLCAEIRNCANAIDDIAIVHDYKSWRKDYTALKAPWDVESSGESYKSNRSYDENVNWLEFYNTLIEWGDMLEKHFNIMSIRAYGAEGDDLMFMLSKIYNQAGKNVILFSTDGDMIQVCTTKENGTYTAMYKKQIGTKDINYASKNVLLCDYALHNSLINESTQSMFDFNVNVADIQNWYKTHFNEYSCKNITKHILMKICTGDAGDNVSPLMQRKSGDRTYKLTEKIVTKALESMQLTWDSITVERLYDVEFIKLFTKTLHNDFMKMLTLPIEFEHFYVNKFIENRHLMHLSENEIPLQVQTSIKEALKNKMSVVQTNASLHLMSNYKDVLSTMKVVESTESDFFETFK